MEKCGKTEADQYIPKNGRILGRKQIKTKVFFAIFGNNGTFKLFLYENHLINILVNS